MHNVAMEKYGSAWNPSWRHLDGDGEIVWGPGSELSEKGREQARVSCLHEPPWNGQLRLA